MKRIHLRKMHKLILVDLWQIEIVVLLTKNLNWFIIHWQLVFEMTPMQLIFYVLPPRAEYTIQSDRFSISYVCLSLLNGFSFWFRKQKQQTGNNGWQILTKRMILKQTDSVKSFSQRLYVTTKLTIDQKSLECSEFCRSMTVKCYVLCSFIADKR